MTALRMGWSLWACCRNIVAGNIIEEPSIRLRGLKVLSLCGFRKSKAAAFSLSLPDTYGKSREFLSIPDTPGKACWRLLPEA